MGGYTHLALFAQHQAIGRVPTECFDFFFRAVRGWAMFVPATTTIREQHSGASSCSNIKMFSTRESFSFIPTNKQPQIHFFLSPRKHHSFQQIHVNSHKYIFLPPKTSTTRTKMSRLESIARSPRPLHCAAWAHGRSSTKTNAQILPDAAERDVCRSWCGLSNCNSCYNVMPRWCNQQCRGGAINNAMVVQSTTREKKQRKEMGVRQQHPLG